MTTAELSTPVTLLLLLLRLLTLLLLLLLLRRQQWMERLAMATLGALRRMMILMRRAWEVR